jgi:hypothetical protein
VPSHRHDRPKSRPVSLSPVIQKYKLSTGDNFVKYLITVILCAIIATLPFNAYAAGSKKKSTPANKTDKNKPQLLEGLPKLLQGEWVALAHSFNKGVTLIDDDPYIFAYVSDDSVILSSGSGNASSIERVIKTKNKNDKDQYAIRFKNQTVWGVTDTGPDKTGRTVWLVQSFPANDDGEFVEATRMLIKILTNEDKIKYGQQ